jgi:hypothetical protein
VAAFTAPNADQPSDHPHGRPLPFTAGSSNPRLSGCCACAPSGIATSAAKAAQANVKTDRVMGRESADADTNSPVAMIRGWDTSAWRLREFMSHR